MPREAAESLKILRRAGIGGQNLENGARRQKSQGLARFEHGQRATKANEIKGDVGSFRCHPSSAVLVSSLPENPRQRDISPQRSSE